MREGRRSSEGNREMQVVLLRVGIDTGSGGMHGPLFSDGSFEYIPIPDQFGGKGVDERTYGNTSSITGYRLVDYFPETRREKVFGQSIHFDPEFETFTYGDPTPSKALLRVLSEGSFLVFYAGLKGWKFDSPPALYIIGFFEVARAGLATSFSRTELAVLFKNNFHVMHRDVFEDQRERLVLVKGSANSRLLKKAVKISSIGTDKAGRPLHRLAPQMQEVFGGFSGNTSIQRSPPRWVAPEFTERAARFISALR
jgi:Nucleotide modification associated domain 3